MIRLPEQWWPLRTPTSVAAIDIPSTRLREADLAVDDLIASIERQGLQQSIGLRAADADYQAFELIWGRRRLEAYRKGADRLGKEIGALVYPPGLPDEWARLLEIDENDQRQDLTADERAASTVERLAALKLIEDIESQESLTKSDFTEGQPAEPKPKTGRGHTGIIQKVAEQQRVNQAAVRKRVRKVAEVIGEPVDPDKDTSAELGGKAAKFRRMAAGYDAERKKARKVAREAHPTPRGPSLLDAVGALVAFTPTSAKHWLADHPDDAVKIKGLVDSVNVLAATLTEVLCSGERVMTTDEEFQDVATHYLGQFEEDAAEAKKAKRRRRGDASRGAPA